MESRINPPMKLHVMNLRKRVQVIDKTIAHLQKALHALSEEKEILVCQQDQDRQDENKLLIGNLDSEIMRCFSRAEEHICEATKQSLEGIRLIKKARRLFPKNQKASLEQLDELRIVGLMKLQMRRAGLKMAAAWFKQDGEPPSLTEGVRQGLDQATFEGVQDHVATADTQ